MQVKKNGNSFPGSHQQADLQLPSWEATPQHAQQLLGKTTITTNNCPSPPFTKFLMLSSTSNGVEYGLSLWSVEVSCHHSVPSLESGRSEGEKSHERKQTLFHSSQQRGVASTLSQPQMQRTAPQRLPGNEFNSIPARHSTISTPYSSPFIPRVM